MKVIDTDKSPFSIERLLEAVADGVLDSRVKTRVEVGLGEIKVREIKDKTKEMFKEFDWTRWRS